MSNGEENQKRLTASKSMSENKVADELNKILLPKKLFKKIVQHAYFDYPNIFRYQPRARSFGKVNQEDNYQKMYKEKLTIISELIEMGIDPELFEDLLQKAGDRELKKRFGYWFLLLTFIFTTASYCIVVLNGVFTWNVSDVAITALIIETPMQFIGLLYLIAKNLFPSSKGEDKKQK